MGLTPEEWVDRTNWPAVRDSLVAREVELRGSLTLLHLDMTHRSREPRPHETEQLEGLLRNLADIERWLTVLEHPNVERYLKGREREGG